MPRVRDSPTAKVTAARRARRLLEEHDELLVGRRVLALCSGGADSVALVALLGSLPRGAAPAAIEVLWLDHALRDDIAAERAAARAVAASIGARFHELRADVDLTRQSGGVEAAARRWRYACAARLAASRSCSVVCTGHTASDQLEQALLALVGVTGRGGDVDAIPVSRELAPGIALVRPLLTLARADVEAVCLESELTWSVDPTNADADSHARNAVRHKVVPQLLALHDGAGIGLARAARRRAGERDTLRSLSSALLDAWGADHAIDVRRLAPLDSGARGELLAAWLRAHVDGRDVGSRIVHAVEQLALAPARAACARVDLPGNACVRRDGYDLVITTARLPERPAP